MWWMSVNLEMEVHPATKTVSTTNKVPRLTILPVDTKSMDHQTLGADESLGTLLTRRRNEQDGISTGCDRVRFHRNFSPQQRFQESGKLMKLIREHLPHALCVLVELFSPFRPVVFALRERSQDICPGSSHTSCVSLWHRSVSMDGAWQVLRMLRLEIDSLPPLKLDTIFFSTRILVASKRCSQHCCNGGQVPAP